LGRLGSTHPGGELLCGKIATVSPPKELTMRLPLAFALLLTAAAPAFAALDVGEQAPDFTATAAKAGKTYKFSLAESLAKGPVVLYFFPAAFTDGCSIEAQQFAEALPQFEALGASIVGVSGDDIETLGRFSVQVCQGKFPVASDASKTIMKSYDAVMQSMPDFATRVSYVIAPNGSILYNYLSLNPSKHVANTLAAVRTWSQSKASR
jgi:thioredoxin-dependent peroxiredoxin